MSALDLIPDAELVSEPVTKPPTRWRNWALVFPAHSEKCHVCGHLQVFGANTVRTSHCQTFPSKDVAESFAAANLSEHYEYLGAYPDWERHE